MEEKDGELVGRARRGDEQAFAVLYRRYRDWAASLAFRFCGDRDEALDVLQETFAYFFRRLPTFELRAQLKTFLYPVVKHIALNRKRARRSPAPVAEPSVAPADSAIDHLLGGLSEAHREVVCMRFVDGLELAEIAEALEIPIGTVKSRLHHAIADLRRRKSVNLPAPARAEGVE